VQSRKDNGVNLQLVYVTVDTDNADPLGNEPVYDGERIIGITTSGAYGYTVKRTIACAYVESKYAAIGTEFDIAILGDRRSAVVIDEPIYDPTNERLRQ